MQLAETPFAEHPYRLREQPAKLVDRLRLAAMLAKVDIDELRQRRRLDETPFAPEAVERALERFHRCLLGREATTLNTPGATTTDPVAIRPPSLTRAPGRKLEHLSLLLHQGSPFRADPLNRILPAISGKRCKR